MTPPDLSSALELAGEALRLAEKATPGPWRCDRSAVSVAWRIVPFVCGSGEYESQPSEADAAFIVAARTSLPLLAQAVQELARENERLRAWLEWFKRGEEIQDSSPEYFEYLDAALRGDVAP